jgi:muramoyltetrapeptide carboxypeptidase
MPKSNKLGSMTIQHPPALKPGDTIGVMAPSSYVEREDIERAKALFEARGYKVFVHPQTYEREHQSAGTLLQKSLALQGLWQREDIKAIWAAGGGNRALHLSETINFDKLKNKPKILVGFSDVTALLNAVYAHTGIVSLHGPVFGKLDKHKQLDHTLAILSGEKDVSIPLSEAQIITEGKASGHLIGGNLSLFQYLPRTLPGNFWKGGILFLEDCNEEYSHIDRMFLHLRRLGVLGEVSAIVFGQFTGLKDSGRPFGYSLDDIITEHTEGLDIPIVANAPFGHGEDLYALPVGARATLNTKNLYLGVQKPAFKP